MFLVYAFLCGTFPAVPSYFKSLFAQWMAFYCIWQVLSSAFACGWGASWSTVWCFHQFPQGKNGWMQKSHINNVEREREKTSDGCWFFCSEQHKLGQWILPIVAAYVVASPGGNKVRSSAAPDFQEGFCLSYLASLLTKAWAREGRKVTYMSWSYDESDWA